MKIVSQDHKDSNDIGAIHEEPLLREIVIYALQGSASTLAMRHDIKVEIMVKHAVAIAKQAIEELRKC